MQANPRYLNIDGAPFFIGARVSVIRLIDEQANPIMLNQMGIVEYYEYDCGCGQQFPHLPMIGVRFGRSIEEYWPEELEVQS